MNSDHEMSEAPGKSDVPPKDHKPDQPKWKKKGKQSASKAHRQTIHRKDANASSAKAHRDSLARGFATVELTAIANINLHAIVRPRELPIALIGLARIWNLMWAQLRQSHQRPLAGYFPLGNVQQQQQLVVQARLFRAVLYIFSAKVIKCNEKFTERAPRMYPRRMPHEVVRDIAVHGRLLPTALAIALQQIGNITVNGQDFSPVFVRYLADNAAISQAINLEIVDFSAWIQGLPVGPLPFFGRQITPLLGMIPGLIIRPQGIDVPSQAFWGAQLGRNAIVDDLEQLRIFCTALRSQPGNWVMEVDINSVDGTWAQLARSIHLNTAAEEELHSFAPVSELEARIAAAYNMGYQRNQQVVSNVQVPSGVAGFFYSVNPTSARYAVLDVGNAK